MSDREENNRSNDEEDEASDDNDNNNNDDNNKINFRKNSGSGGGKRKHEGAAGGGKRANKRKKPDYKREFFNNLDAETKKSLIPLTNEDEIFAQLNEKDDLQTKLDLIHKIAKSQQQGIQRLERKENKRTIKQAGKAKTQELYKTLKRGLDGDLKYDRKIENIIESYRTYELLKSFAIEQLSRADVTEGGAGGGSEEEAGSEEANEEEVENRQLYENLYALTKKEHRKLNDNEKKKLNKFLQKHAKQIMEQSNLGRWI